MPLLPPKLASVPAQTGRTVAVTGANSGIGFVTARTLAEAGARVLLVCRNPTKAAEAAERIATVAPNAPSPEVVLCDFSELASIRRAADEVRDRVDRLDVLVNNAGAYFPERKTSVDGFEMTFAVNHLGYFLFTELMRPLLLASAPARVVSVASLAHRVGALDLGDLDWRRRRYQGMRVYGTSKLANILHTRELGRQLHGTGVTANCLHPGVVSTGFGRDEPGLMNRLTHLGQPFLKTPEQGAYTTLYLATAPELDGRTGGYYAGGKLAATSAAASDRRDGRTLWRLSRERCGL